MRDVAVLVCFGAPAWLVYMGMSRKVTDDMIRDASAKYPQGEGGAAAKSLGISYSTYMGRRCLLRHRDATGEKERPSESRKIEKMTSQLGMNPGTAQNRLKKDLLFYFAKKEGHTCFRCGGDLERKGFSIEHKTPWLDAPDPVDLFFDIGNIAFSHLSCNSGAARNGNALSAWPTYANRAEKRRKEYAVKKARNKANQYPD